LEKEETMITIKTWDITNNTWQEFSGDTSLSAIQKATLKDYLLLFVSYTKGDEDNATILAKLRFDGIDEDIYFDDAYVDGSNVVESNLIKLEESKDCVIPIRLYRTVDKVKIEANLNNVVSSAGTLKIWVKPSV